ncbi:MAG: hypothetical protein WCP03_01265 [Candidatus Saccharibacteria bacterium]
MSEIYLVEKQDGQGDLTKEFVDLIRDEESIKLLARILGTQSVKNVVETEADIDAIYVYDPAPENIDPISIEFTPERVVIARLNSIDKFSEQNITEIVQVISGTAVAEDDKLLKAAILTVPVDARFPTELELRDINENLK